MCAKHVRNEAQATALIMLSLQTVFPRFLPPSLLSWNWLLSYWSISHVFAKGKSPPRHLQSLQALKYSQETQQREIQLLWVTFRGWIYCLFGLVLQQLVVKPKPHVLAPPEIKVPSFFSYLRQEIFNIAFCNSRECNTEAHMLSFPHVLMKIQSFICFSSVCLSEFIALRIYEAFKSLQSVFVCISSCNLSNKSRQWAGYHWFAYELAERKVQGLAQHSLSWWVADHSPVWFQREYFQLRDASFNLLMESGSILGHSPLHLALTLWSNLLPWRWRPVSVVS